MSAGLPCPAWEQDNVVKFAAESGNCSDDAVLSTYATDADLQEAVETMRGMNEMLTQNGIEATPLLIGANWIINAPAADKLAPRLGGTVER